MSESENKCSMQHCLNTFNTEGKTFFNFPTDLNLCRKWIESCGRQDFVEIFSYGGALPFILKYVCQDHFLEEDFLKEDLNLVRGLRSYAIPKPLIKSESIFFPEEESLPFLVESKQDTAPEVIIKREPPDDIVVKTEPGICLEAVSVKIKEFDDFEYEEKALKFKKRAERVRLQRLKETPEQRAERLEKDKIRRQKKEIERLQRFDDSFEEERALKLKKRALKQRLRRGTETPEQKAKRLEQDKMRRREKRELERKQSLFDPEVEEKLRMRRMRESMLAAMKRQNETPEERALRQERERIRLREKRRIEKELSETDPEIAIKLELRKLKYRIVKAIKRQNETEEEKERRREKDRNRMRMKRYSQREVSNEELIKNEQRSLRDLKHRVSKALGMEIKTEKIDDDECRLFLNSGNKIQNSEAFTCDVSPIEFCSVANDPLTDEHQNPTNITDSLTKETPTINSENNNDKPTIPDKPALLDNMLLKTLINMKNQSTAEQQAVTDELVRLQSQIKEAYTALKTRRSLPQRSAKSNHYLSQLQKGDSDNEESTEEDETDNNSDDSEYDRYLENVSSDEG